MLHGHSVDDRAFVGKPQVMQIYFRIVS